MRIILTLAAALFGLAGLAGAPDAAVIEYTTKLSGPAEAEPNNSPGTGRSRLVVDTVARTFDIEVEFSGLLAGTTVAHVHGPTPLPGSGAAGVMTTTPTFPGFPAGVTSGTYVNAFDTSDAATFNPAFVSEQGGTVDAAEAAFFAALAEGRAYLNIHSSLFPGGEIRGFYAPAPIPLPAGALLTLTALGAFGAVAARRRAA